MVLFHQFAQLGRHAAAFVRCLALLVVKQPHRGVFVVPDCLRPIVGGVGWDAVKKGPKLLLVTHGTLDQITDDFREMKELVGFFTEYQRHHPTAPGACAWLRRGPRGSFRELRARTDRGIG